MLWVFTNALILPGIFDKFILFPMVLCC
uniref:Uncharacterized protein n=1 Tax=Moniliophthora roreri TaxID=221103 RepID=A0A0W0FPB7_MONRR